MANKLYYIADLDFSHRNASTQRIINNCKSLSFNSDVKIEVIGRSQNGDFCQEGFKIRNISMGIHFFKRYINIFRKGFLFVNKIKDLANVSCIIYYGVSSIILLPIYLYCKKNKIKLIIDVVEWYDYKHLPYGQFGPFAFDVHFAITKLIPKCDAAIVISRYLQLYYKRKKLPVLLIPPLVDAKKSELLSNEHKLNAESSFLNLIYAGFPGKKDMLPLMVTAVEELNLNNIKVKLHIIGPSKQELIKFMSAELSENIICYGRVEQYLIPKYLSQADFSLLLRRQERYAEAGFPTKFVESMNCGLPVISNLTSDLHLYLKEGSNGFVLKDCTETAIIDKIKQITNCRSLIIQNMKVNAKNTAIENFDFRLYSNGLRNFCFDS